MADDAIPGKRIWLVGLSGIGGKSVLMLCALVLMVAAADRSGLLTDWSADHRFTLSQSLVKILKQQQRKVDLIGLWSEDPFGLGEQTSEGLRLMAQENPGVISYRHIDPQIQRIEFDRFEKRYAQKQLNAIYVVHSDDSAPTDANEPTPSERIDIDFSIRRKLQREIGAALSNLNDPNRPQAILLNGHGCLHWGGDETDDENGGELFRRELGLNGFRTSTVDLAQGSHVPATALLILAGPTQPLGSTDVAAIEDHLKDGGACLVLGDDRLPRDLRSLLLKRGVDWGTPQNDYPPDWLAFLSASAERSPPVIGSLDHRERGQRADFAMQRLLLSAGDVTCINPKNPVSNQAFLSNTDILSPDSVWVYLIDPRRVDPDRQAALIEAFKTLGTPPFQPPDWLLATASDCWLKSRTEDALSKSAAKSTVRTFHLAWTIESAPTEHSVVAGRGARLAVWGSREAASNGVLRLEKYANATLLADMAKWLIHREPNIDIPESEIRSFTTNISDGNLYYLMAILGVILPCLFIGGAIIAWWERR